jgi:hypothetical protein
MSRNHGESMRGIERKKERKIEKDEIGEVIGAMNYAFEAASVEAG